MLTQHYKWEVNQFRFEVMLYLFIHTKFTGDLFIENIHKYNYLSDDLVNDKLWQDKHDLLTSSQLPRLQEQSDQLINKLEATLRNKINHVSEHIQSGDNKNVIMLSRSGKTKWKLPNKGVGDLLNNSFFEQLKQLHIANLIRFSNQKINLYKHSSM